MSIGQRIQALRRYIVAEGGYWSWELETVEGVITRFCRNGDAEIKTDDGRRIILDKRCEILETE
jgi:hypothetical protein